MANIEGGSIQWKASIDTSAFNASLQGMRKALSEFASSMKNLDTSVASGNKSLGNLSSGASKAASSLNSTSNAAKGNTASIGAMTGAVAAGTAIYEGMTSALRSATGFLGDSVQSANKYQAALLGLSSVAGAFGNNQKDATQAAQELARDGLLTVSDAAVGLKNLLATGFNLDQAIVLMNRFKDTAAFGRQSALGFGESIRGATEGVKNGNCLVGETPVLIEGGEEVSIGELYKRGKPVRVYSLCPDGSMRHTPISHVINNGVKPVYRLKTNRGKNIRATGNHRFLTPDGWKMLNQLVIGEEILSIDRVSGYNTSSIWEEQSNIQKENANVVASHSYPQVPHNLGVGCVLPNSVSSVVQTLISERKVSMPKPASVAVAAEVNGDQKILLGIKQQTGREVNPIRLKLVSYAEKASPVYQNLSVRDLENTAQKNADELQDQDSLGNQAQDTKSVLPFFASGAVVKSNLYLALLKGLDFAQKIAEINGKVLLGWLVRITRIGKVVSYLKSTESEVSRLIRGGVMQYSNAMAASANDASITSMAPQDTPITSYSSHKMQASHSKFQMGSRSANHATLSYTLNRETVESIELDTWEEVYDLSVPETRNFIAGGLVVHNSILTDNAGITKNLSVILREMGKSEQDVMNITSDASVRQALFTGLMRESAAQVGDAAKLSDSYAGAQARAAAQTEIFKQNVGGVVQLITGGILQAFTSFIGNNQQLIISFGLAAVAAVGVATGLFLVIKAIALFKAISFTAAVGNPLILALTVIALLAGVIAFKAIDRLQKKLAESNKKMLEGGDAANTLPPALNNASKAAKELAEKLAEIDEQIEKTKRNFAEQLAELVKSHQDKVRDIEKQLQKENAAFAKSASEKKKSFEQEQNDATKTHEDRLIEIQRQIDEELASNRNANSLKLRDLQATLAKEKSTFDTQNAARQAKYQEDLANDQAAHDEKVTNLTTELDQERALLEKHAADIAAVRNVILLDEIDKLKRGNDEQLASLEKQKQDTIKKNGETNQGLLTNTNQFLADLQKKTVAANGIGDSFGKEMGKAFKEAILKEFTDTFKGIGRFVVAVNKTIIDLISGKWILQRKNPWELLNDNWIKSGIGGSDVTLGRAMGGPVMPGRPVTVGEFGRETFVPNTPGTILPHDVTEDILGRNSGVTINQTNNVYNQVDLTQGLRDLAWQLAN